VIGASTDTPETQREFAESLAVPYPMVGDVDRRLTSSFDVLWPLIRVSRRVTYVIDHAGITNAMAPGGRREVAGAPSLERRMISWTTDLPFP
jgi:peroxiredoxin